MSKLPLPLRNYEHLMRMAKRRLMFIEEFNDKNVDFLTVELIAVQMRKIIEAVSYGCVCACELGGEELNEEAAELYAASAIFSELKRRNLGFVPQACSFSYKGDKEIDEWSIKNKDLVRSEVFKSANDYLGVYKKLHQYAHEFHPRRSHHMLHKDGLDRAISFLQPIKKRLTNSLWQHFIPCGNRALIVDFGKRDKNPPEIFVFHRRDGGVAWPILFAATEPKDVASSNGKARSERSP